MKKNEIYEVIAQSLTIQGYVLEQGEQFQVIRKNFGNVVVKRLKNNMNLEMSEMALLIVSEKIN